MKKNFSVNPIVTICLITYNHAKFIEKSINSVLSQKCEYHYIIIVADDCSTDGTREIIKKYVTKFPQKIKLLDRQKNIGSSENGRDVFRHVKTKYCIILEGDDYWICNDKLNTQINFLEKNIDYAGIAHQSLILYENGTKDIFYELDECDLGLLDLIRGRKFHTTSLLFQSKIIDLFLEAPPVLSGDRLQSMLVAICGKIKYITKPMCIYRLHPNGLSSNVKPIQMLSDLKAISFLTKIKPDFPKFKYKSYVFATIGFNPRSNYIEKIYYLSLSLFFSFSYFPKNITFIIRKILGYKGI